MLCRCGYALVSTEASPVLPDRCPVCDGALREPEPPSPAPPQLRRDSIPGYRIEELIGRGRMGCVYRATQISLDRPVALRILPPSLSRDRAYIHSFLEQAAAASRLEHPNLVPVNERGFVAGRGYLVTELVAGPTLRERVREAGALPQRDALRAASQAAAALAYLHDRGVVHGNVKPANLMQDREGSVKLCDLGLPKHHVPPRPEAFPDPGRANLPYASPEQLGGHPPDARSDVFGLGTALYELLTGHLPFGSDDPRMILRRQTSGQVILPRQFNPGISPAIEKLVLRMIEPNPARRPATGAEVAAALRATPRLGARRHRAGSDRSTLRTVAIVAGAVLLALFACGVLLKLADSLDRGRQQPSATEPAPAKPAVQP